MNFIQKYLAQFTELSKQSILLFTELTSLKSFSKNTVITNIDETPTNFFILKSGIARSFIVDSKGNEHTISLFTSASATGSLYALVNNKPSQLIYDCLTNCEFYTGNFNRFLDIAQKNKDLFYMYSKILEKAFFRLENKIEELSILNATERYLKLMKEIPDIEDLIPQYNIASYLNISPVQLSRIRKEILSK